MFVGMRVVTTVAVSLARDIMCFVSELDGSVLFWDTIDSMAVVKCFKAWSEYRMVLSGVVQELVPFWILFEILLFLFGAFVFVILCAWLIEVAWAAAAIVVEEEDPMTMLNIIGLEISRCLLFEGPFMHAVPRVVSIWEPFFIEFLWLCMMCWDIGQDVGLFLQIFF